MTSIQAAYESLPYPDFVHPLTDPARLAALGRIFGISPANPGAARVLDIGCCSGTNILSMAERLPGSRFVGLDFAGPAIASARALAAEARLTNVEFRQADLLAWEPGGEKFDYIIAWGFYSWVPDEVKDRLLAVCRECLAPDGIACIAYLTYPGCKQASALRDLLRLRTVNLHERAQKLAVTHATLDFLDRACAAMPVMPHAAFMRSELQRIRRKEDPVVLHDELGVYRDPCYFLQFTAQAGKHGLRYLGETEFHTMMVENLPPEQARELTAMQLSQLEAEQMMDYVSNRSVRGTLLVGAEAKLDGRLHPEAMADLSFQPRLQTDGKGQGTGEEGHFLTDSGRAVTLRGVCLVAFIRTLAERSRASTPYGELLTAAQRAVGRQFTAIEQEKLCQELLILYGRRQTEVSAWPYSPPAQVSAYPRLTPMNLAMVRQRGMMITGLQSTVRLTDEALSACSLLDGSRSLEGLRAATGWPEAKLSAFLDSVRQVGHLA